ncbi:uncharacterized protein [Haliotis asinina]|uniref:uncharacterized protein n=1 Tax=Haliotis asinina TaxID=109174 RepID=UPI003531A0A6
MYTGMPDILMYAAVLQFALEIGVLQIFSAAEGVVSDKAGKMFLLSFLPTHDSSGNILLVLSAHNETRVQVENQFYNISLTYDIEQHGSVNVSLSSQLRYRNHLEIERKAVIVNSTADIVVHVFNIGNITSDGYVALPTEALSTRYLLAAFDKPSTIFSVFSNAKPSVSAFTIAALEDNTTITIKFKHSLSSCGVQPKSTTVLGSFLNQFTFSFPQASVREDAKQKEVIMTIHKYDVIGTNCTVDPTGTIITSNRPVSVVSGGVCSFVPHAMMPECDHMEEMMIPSELFGSHFVFHELGGRPSGAIYRIIANENHTSITSTLGHGGTLHESQAADINIKETGSMCLSTSKPVLVVMFSKGSHADVPERFGGPFMTVVPSTERFSYMPIHLPHLWNMTFLKTRMTPYVTVIQKQECKDNFDMFDEVRIIPDCKYAVATIKLTRSYEQLVLMPEMKYGAIFYGFGSGEGFGFSTGISMTNKTSELHETKHCGSFPCLNDAECIEACPYSCVCRDGFQGRQCEQQKNNTMEPLFKDTDDCISNPCVRGQCRDRIDAYKCVCEPGFQGVNCEKDIDECLGDPCVHGDCKDGVNAYTALLCFFPKYCELLVTYPISYTVMLLP